MKFKVKNQRGYNINTLVRAITYRYLGEDEKTKEASLVRPLERGGYPRFHLFLIINSKNNEFIFKLHIDQRKPVYNGSPAHSADYEGEVVGQEAKRIKDILEE